MRSFRRRRFVDFSAAEMFALVKDVESYPEFVPVCREVAVRERCTGNGIETLVVDMQIGPRAARPPITIHLTCDAAMREIQIDNIGRPFMKMESRWSFRDDPSRAQAPRCCVTFTMRYEVESLILGFVVGATLEAGFERYADAFIERAGLVYKRD